jgi:hypothetical protein
VQLALKFRNMLPEIVRQELDNLVSTISGFWNVEHKGDGTHSTITCDSLIINGKPIGADGASGLILNVSKLLGRGSAAGPGLEEEITLGSGLSMTGRVVSSVGVIGPQGPQGIQGAPGATGATGATGAQGPAGATGSRAERRYGTTGPQGPTGGTGQRTGVTASSWGDRATGRDWPCWAAGDEGPQGEAGTGINIKGTVPTTGDPPPTGAPATGGSPLIPDTCGCGIARRDLIDAGPSGATGSRVRKENKA